MSGIFNAIRSVLFNVVFYLYITLFLAFIMVPLALLMKSDRGVRGAILVFCKTTLWLARVIMGIKLEIRNAEMLPKSGAFILAAAHQSYMDPIITYTLRSDVTALAKKELFSLPLLGTVFRKIKIVRIDRQSKTAHRAMDAVADHVVELGRPLIIYPQATRVPIGQTRKLKSGSYFLQEDTGLPVYTVATNTGLFWTKGFWHRSGTAVFEITGEIAAGTKKEDFMAELEDKVVARSNALVAEAGYAALLPKPSA
ncbi:lysophospholipid acyltransferase family protein [Kordiimonas marina]|uniref:lysophospholipid acyltransferase family protein n=1 Tax=Kordiimonas marina TaxID=2872312 RepID=UPI001FF69D21|nr:1-acyl-sn-glycerol-3-phosphate acyltransferase [Kordiimonas marina]